MLERRLGLPLRNYTAELQELFKARKPLIAMLHLKALPGEPGYTGIDDIKTQAHEDLIRLQRGGVNGILIENWKADSVSPFASPETAAGLFEVVSAIQSDITVPFGLNVLNNDYRVAFDIAAKTNAAFIQLDVLVDHVVSDFSYSAYAKEHPFEISVDISEVRTLRQNPQIAHKPMYVFVQPKHYKMIDPQKTIEQSASQAVEAGASGLIVTKATGHAPTLELITRVKKHVGNYIPVGIGSGFSRENAGIFLPMVDFAIVGTDLKVGQITDNPVDEAAVEELIKLISHY